MRPEQKWVVLDWCLFNQDKYDQCVALTNAGWDEVDAYYRVKSN